MKRITTFALSCILWMISPVSQAQHYDYLLTATDTGSGVTTNNSKAWSDITSVTIDVTNINSLFLTANINMHPDGFNTNGREANYNIYQSDNPSNNSGVIKRQIINNNEAGVESWGIGTLIHVFDVSGLSGNKTFILEQRNNGNSQNGRNVFSFARLVAIALNTNVYGHALSNGSKSLNTYVTTSSSTYSAIPGLTTDTVSLPFKGDIYVALSINSKASAGNTVAQYKLQYSTDNGVTYADLGKPVKRSMYNSWDDGIVSMTAMLRGQEPGNGYKFRVMHQRVSGSATVSSGNANLVAISLSHTGGGYFQTMYSHIETGGSITGVSTPSQSVLSNALTTSSFIGSVKPRVFVSTQYLVEATGLDATSNPVQRMRAQNQLFFSTGGFTIFAEPYYRFIGSNSAFGAGGFIGLTRELGANTTYTGGMNHSIAYISNPDSVEDEVLTTSEVILCAFETFDKQHFLWTGNVSNAWELDANWAYGKAPTSADNDVTIPNVINSPVISGTTTRECGLLTIESGATLQINDNAVLKPSSDIVNNGTIIIGNNSSLLQTAAGADNNSGQGTYEVKRTGNVTDFVYNIWSSPMQSASVSSTFINANPCDLWVFEGATQRWNHDYAVGFSTSCYGNNVVFTSNDVISGGDGMMDAGRGYFAPGNATPTRTFTGKVNNGPISIPIQATTLGNPGGTGWGDDDWNLIGNPYPSAISATAFWNENSVNNARIITGLYFWDEADTTGGYNQNSDYASWNLAGGVNSGNSAKIPTGQIASGQGFWVVANSSTSVVFDNSMRTGLNDQFFKNGVDDNHNLWVSCTSPSGYQNNILVGFNPNSTDGVDADFDAHKLIGNAHIKFASVIDSKEYVIQSLAMVPLQQTKVIPLTVSSDEYGDHVFANYKMQNMSANYQIYLRDNYLGITKDLRVDSMVVSLDPNVNYTHRFELVVVNEMLVDNSGGQTSLATSIDEMNLSTMRVIQNESELIVSNEKGFSGFVKVVDITGKVIWSKSQNTEVNALTIDISNWNNGVYILHVTNQENQVYRTKFMKIK